MPRLGLYVPPSDTGATSKPTAASSKPARHRKPPQALPLKWQLVVVINGAAYAVTPLKVGHKAVALQLQKPTGEMHQVSVTPTGLECTCEDAVFCPERPLGCKHRRAVNEIIHLFR